MLSNTDQVERLYEIFARQKKGYLQQGPPPVDERFQRIATLRDMLVRHHAIIHESVCQDFDHHSGKLVDMLAGGNRIIVKPTEIAPATSAVLARIVAESYDPDVLAVIEGGPDVAAVFASMPCS